MLELASLDTVSMELLTPVTTWRPPTWLAVYVWCMRCYALQTCTHVIVPATVTGTSQTKELQTSIVSAVCWGLDRKPQPVITGNYRCGLLAVLRSGFSETVQMPVPELAFVCVHTFPGLYMSVCLQNCTENQVSTVTNDPVCNSLLAAPGRTSRLRRWVLLITVTAAWHASPYSQYSPV